MLVFIYRINNFLKQIETNKVKKDFYLIRQDNTIYKFSSIEQDKSKLQKQISNLLILTEMIA